MIDRLTLSDKTISAMVSGLRRLPHCHLPLERNSTIASGQRPFNMQGQGPDRRCGYYYESRPNVTVDAAAICLKSQNAVILRGGEAKLFIPTVRLPLFLKKRCQGRSSRYAVQIIPTTDRKAIEQLLVQDEFIDLVIPRGGESLIRMVVEKSHIPVIKHYKGVCHVFIAPSADIDKAIAIAVNAKVQRPGVCNAMETLILDVGLTLKKEKQL